MKFKIVEEVKNPEDYGIKNYKFRPDGTLDVFQNVNLSYKNLTKLPFKFGEIDGDFGCSFNKLKSLEGAPKIINGSFYCSNNKLTSLKGAPEIIYGSFWCEINNLKSLQDCTKIINGDFHCNNNNLKSLKYAPKIVNGDFFCGFNQLKSLEGLNLDNISGEIYVNSNPNLKLTEKEQLWMTLNPGRLIL